MNLIKQNTNPTTPAAAPASSGSSLNPSSFGPFALAGTAAMMAEILKLLQELCKLENEYSELAKTDISQAGFAAQANAQATYNSGMAQSQATRDQAFSSLGSAIAMGGGLLTMGIATGMNRGDLAEIDKQTDVNTNITNKVNAARLSPQAEDIELQERGLTPDEKLAAVKARYSDAQKALAEKLEKGTFGTKGAEELKYTDEDFKKAIGYIREKAPLIVNSDSADTILDRMVTTAKDNNGTLSREKEAIMTQKGQISSIGQTFGQVGSSVSQGAAQQFAADEQAAQAQAEEDKSYSQYTQQIAQTAQQQVLSGRDNKDQQVTQTLQLVQSAQQANQIN